MGITAREQTQGLEGGIFSVFREQEAGLRRFVRRLLPTSSEVEDITQETILRALQAERDRDIQHPKAYLYMVDPARRRNRSSEPTWP